MKKNIGQNSLILIPREELTGDGIHFRFSAGEEMTFIMRFYEKNEAFSCVLKKGWTQEKNRSEVQAIEEKQGLFRRILLPNSPERITRKLFGTTIFKGTAVETGTRALIDISSSCDILSCAPLLATGRFFPDNAVCGFAFRGEYVKYIFLLHSNEERSYKGGEQIKPLFATLMCFRNNELEKIWGFT
jgi:hypothetical protein